jgi:hypothetical protein
MVCSPATSEAGARWPRIGLVVVATTSCRDNKVQMIRPYEPAEHLVLASKNYLLNLKKPKIGQKSEYMRISIFLRHVCFDILELLVFLSWPKTIINFEFCFRAQDLGHIVD